MADDPQAPVGGGRSGDGDEKDEDIMAPMESKYFGFNDDNDIDNDDDDVDALPPFASEANKILSEKVKVKEALLAKNIEELQENTERVNIMADHLRNVEQEHLHTQALCDAKSQEIKTEEHIRQLADREAGRLKSDILKMDKYMVDVQDRLNSLQNAMVLANEKMEQFKLQMNWNEEELLQWSLAAKQKDEDRQALLKYQKMDNVKIKNLTLKVEKAARIVQERKRQLDHEVTEAQAVQIELDKTAEEYRRLHQERQDMARKWEECEQNIKRRDRLVIETAEQVRVLKLQTKEKQRLAFEQKAFLEREQMNNKQLNVGLGSMDRMAEKKREQLNSMRREINDFQAEVSTQRNELKKAEAELKATLSMNENLQQLKTEKIQRLEEFKDLLASTKRTLHNDYLKTDNLANKANEIDQLYQQHVEQMANMNKALETLKENMFKHSHELFNLRKQEADLIAEISGAQGTSRNLQARIHELDQRSLKQQEMLYNIEFQVQQLERKVSFASGKRSLEETLELKAQIAVLQGDLDGLNSQHSMINNQVKRLHDDLRAAHRKQQNIITEKANLADKINKINLENSSAEREVKESQKKKEENIVQHDVLKLEVKRLRDTLTAIADQVFGLENRKLQLVLSMKEREKEVKLHKDIQRAELKAAEDQRHKLAKDLKERQIKVEKLKKKYETLAGRLRKADEEEHSQAFYIIQSAQEREELQREGDGLNRAIRHTQKEIRMLTRTLSNLNSRNKAYRESFQKADANSSDALLKRDLEEQIRHVNDSLYKRKTYLRELSGDFEQRRKVLAELINNIGQAHTEISQKQKELESVQQALDDQSQNMRRAESSEKIKRDEFRRTRMVQDNQITAEETYINVLHTRRKNQLLLNLLRNYVDEHPELQDSVDEVMEEVGLMEGSEHKERTRFPDIGSPSRPGTSQSNRPRTGASNRPTSRGGLDGNLPAV